MSKVLASLQPESKDQIGEKHVFKINGSLAEYQYQCLRMDNQVSAQDQSLLVPLSMYHRVTSTPDGNLKMELVLPMGAQTIHFQSTVKILTPAHCTERPRAFVLDQQQNPTLTVQNIQKMQEDKETSNQNVRSKQDACDEEDAQTTIRDRRISAQSNFSSASTSTQLPFTGFITNTSENLNKNIPCERKVQAKKQYLIKKPTSAQLKTVQEEQLPCSEPLDLEKQEDLLHNNNIQNDRESIIQADKSPQQQWQIKSETKKGAENIDEVAVSENNSEDESGLKKVQAASDKKNVVKNFVKAFRAYINVWGDESELLAVMGIIDREELIRLRLRFTQLEKKRKYNNKLIKDLILHKVYGSVFCHFLRKHAYNWLENSLVLDKASHRDVLKLYLLACDDVTQLDQLRILKSKRKIIN